MVYQLSKSVSTPDELKVSERVGAFIIRKNRSRQYELLLFWHPTSQEAPVQIPGGGLESGESVEQALCREIYEESGLVDLPILRKLGVCERCWLDTRNLARRHYFLLEAPANTPDVWDHIVSGDGDDNGMRFSYFWSRPLPQFQLTGGSASFLNAYYIPELYDSP